ncbi:MAG: multicopper oxidase family protein [Gemmatimonadaceae bacterium]
MNLEFLSSRILVPACVACLLLLPGGSSLGLTARRDLQAIAPPLRTPALLTNQSVRPRSVEVTIVAEPAQLSLVPGALSAGYAYNGQVPGPTLEAYEGDEVTVHFVNRLPEPTTIHWHGLHIPNASDGSPYHPVAPGRSRDYVFTLQKGSAGTYWYHPHPDQATGGQIARGLFGTFIVRAHDDPVPRDIAEKVIVLSDNRFLPNGSLDLPAITSPQGVVDLSNGREGDRLYVNGQVMPVLSIRAGETQRWRVINASAARVYRLAIPGITFLHIGSDGGVFEHPVEAKEILVANSERVELLVRATGKPGSTTTLQDLPYDRYVPQTRPRDWKQTRNLLTLQYTTDEPLEPVAIPATLRPVQPLDESRARRKRDFVMQQGFINGKAHAMDRVDEHVRLGDTEVWTIENVVGMDHPFHLHGFQFQVIDRDGVPEPYRSWKDTINIPKHSVARIIVRFDDFPGKWMYHCHILDHEDNGMMGVLEVK